MSRILIVDDEDGLRDMLCDAMRIAGFDAVGAADGREARQITQSMDIDLIVADVNMPVMNGFELLESLRTDGNDVPVILLTAQTERNDVTRGFQIGADDYVKKPFGLEELLLRIQAVLRRTEGYGEESNTLTCGPVTLDKEKYLVLLNGKQVEISPTEFRLLELLMSRKGKVVRKSELLSDVWGINFSANTNVVDTYISYLRKKIHSSDYEGIRTIRGVGFQMDDA